MPVWLRADGLFALDDQLLPPEPAHLGGRAQQVVEGTGGGHPSTVEDDDVIGPLERGAYAGLPTIALV